MRFSQAIVLAIEGDSANACSFLTAQVTADNCVFGGLVLAFGLRTLGQSRLVCVDRIWLGAPKKGESKVCRR